LNGTNTDRWISQGGLWGDGYLGDYTREQPGQWPTPEQEKRAHLEYLHCEIEALKDAQLDLRMQAEWDAMEKELPK